MSTSKVPGSFIASPLAIACAGLLALAVAMGIGRFAFTPILPMMLEDAGISIAAGGLLASANYIGYLLGAIAAMAVPVRHETAIRAGLIAIGITTLAMGLHLPLGTWLLMRGLAGIASAWVMISVSAWSLETLARYQRPLLSGIVFAGVGSGIAIAGVLCLALIQGGAGSSQAWIALGLLSLAATAAIWPFLGHRSNAAGAATPDSRAGYRWNADAIRLVICYGIYGFGYIIPATFLPVMAKKAVVNPALFGWAWPVFGLAAALSTLAVAMLIRRVGNRSLWIACQLILAVGVAMPVVWPHIFAIFLAALMVGGTFTVITLVALQEARLVAGNAARVLIAAMTASFAAGQIAGPLLITYGFQGEAGFSHALLIASSLLVVSAAALASRPKKAQAFIR
jgi:MFS family permease